MSRHSVWVGFALIVVTCLVFGRVCFFEFTIWDDNVVIWADPLLNPPSLANTLKFWTEPFQIDTLYLPVTYTLWAMAAAAGWMNEPDAWGNHLNPYLFHGLNLILHGVCVLLVWRLLRRLVANEWAAAIGALLFALHPVQVETVAWATGTRDLLGTLFSIAAMLAFLQSRDLSDVGRRWAWAGLATLLYLAAILSKSTALVTPILAALVALWKPLSSTQAAPGKERLRLLPALPVNRKRARARESVVSQKKPSLCPSPGTPIKENGRGGRFSATALYQFGIIAGWLLIAAIDAIITRAHQPVDPLALRDQPAMWFRPFVALDALAFYVWKLVWPLSLGIDYGHTPMHVRQSGQWIWTWTVPVLIAAVTLRMGRRAWISAGIFTVALLPTLGLLPYRFEVYYGTVADRYVYPAMVGLSLALAVAISNLGGSRGDSPKRMPLLITGLMLAALALISFHQEAFWRDSMTLFNHAVDVNSHTFAGHRNRGVVEVHDGRFDAAEADFRAMLIISPDAPEAYRGLARAQMGMGRVDEAMADWTQALAAEEAMIAEHGSLAETYRHQLRQHYREAAAIAESAARPEQARAWRRQAGG